MTNNDSSNILDDANILKFFKSFKQENYSVLNKVYQRELKSRSIDQLLFNLTRKYKPQSFDSREDLGISGHFIDVDFNKTNNYLKEKGNFCCEPKINKTKSQMLFNRKIQNFKQNDESKGLSRKEYKEMKEKKIMYIRSLSKRKLASDPGLYNPNYEAIHKRPVFPIIRRAEYQSDIQSVPEMNNTNINCRKSRNENSVDNQANNNSNSVKANTLQKKSESKLTKSSTHKNFIKRNKIDRKENINNDKSAITITKNDKGNRNQTERNDLFSLYKLNMRKAKLNQSSSFLYDNPTSGNLKKTSTVNFEKMTGRHDEVNFYFKRNLVPSVSYSPNYLFNASHVKTVYFSRVKSFSDIKKHQISKSLYSYSVNRDYSLFRLNKERSHNKKK